MQEAKFNSLIYTKLNMICSISLCSISEIVITMSPQGLTWSTLMVGNPGQWYIDIVWTPDSPLTEHQNLCFKAHDALG